MEDARDHRTIHIKHSSTIIEPTLARMAFNGIACRTKNKGAQLPLHTVYQTRVCCMTSILVLETFLDILRSQRLPRHN